MPGRATIPPDVIADVLVTSRRRCCICFALADDSAEKSWQVAHLDHDASNNSVQNLVFLCLEHHDQYDSRTRQSKGLTVEEVRRYRAQLEPFVATSLPLSDADIARTLIAGLDRPAFRTPFHQESSLPRFRSAIAEIRHCGCQDPDCPVYMLSDRAAREMDRRRHDLLLQAQQLDPTFPARFYELAYCGPTLLWPV